MHKPRGFVGTHSSFLADCDNSKLCGTWFLTGSLPDWSLTFTAIIFLLNQSLPYFIFALPCDNPWDLNCGNCMQITYFNSYFGRIQAETHSKPYVFGNYVWSDVDMGLEWCLELMLRAACFFCQCFNWCSHHHVPFTWRSICLQEEGNVCEIACPRSSDNFFSSCANYLAFFLVRLPINPISY